MRNIVLNDSEREVLNRPLEGQGGFQSLLASLRSRVSENDELSLSDNDLERIRRYAFDYANGGWQNRLMAIFGRHLGQDLRL